MLRATVVVAWLAVPGVATAASTHAEGNVGYFAPVDRERELYTFGIDALVGRDTGSKGIFAWRGGLHVNYASGNTIQLDEQLREPRSEGSALGVGPVALLRLQTPELARWRFGIEGSVGLLVHSRRFPPGGDVYDFMRRAGVMLSHRPNQRLTWAVGARVMHVSNGQGLGHHNPSYDAAGVHVGVGWSL